MRSGKQETGDVVEPAHVTRIEKRGRGLYEPHAASYAELLRHLAEGTDTISALCEATPWGRYTVRRMLFTLEVLRVVRRVPHRGHAASWKINYEDLEFVL